MTMTRDGMFTPLSSDEARAIAEIAGAALSTAEMAGALVGLEPGGGAWRLEGQRPILIALPKESA